MLPKVSPNSYKERLGIIKVASVVNEAFCIWRETPTHDVGIDGQIEHVNSQSFATGRIVAVQVKSGESYFSREKEDCFLFYPEEKHIAYWSSFPTPVVLIMHNPTSGQTLFTDARRAVRAAPRKPIEVSKYSIFNTQGVSRALEFAGPLPKTSSEAMSILSRMIESRTGNRSYQISFFDLFFHGITDAGLSIYFGADLASEIADANAALDPDSLGILTRTLEDVEFLRSYVEFLIAHNLAYINYDAWLHLWDLTLIGTFIAPLSKTGLEIISYTKNIEREFPPEPRGVNEVAARERFVRMEIEPSLNRFKYIRNFQQEFRDRNKIL